MLVIDEAYCLHGSSYGEAAINTLVSLVHNEPGEDVAVLLLGYEPQMKRMLRDANPGLQRRFSLEAAFRFADFTDAELELLLHRAAARDGLRLPRAVRKAALASLSRERVQPNFGNAGAVNSLLGRAKTALAARGEAAAANGELTIGDVLGTASADKGCGARERLASMHKCEHVLSHLDAIEAVTARLRADGKLAPDAPAMHVGNYIFTGASGTGKSTVARLLATELFRIGVLTSDAFACESALNLQGDYVGQTKTKVAQSTTCIRRRPARPRR